jgi:uncharacterized protein (TIGR03000 family)
MYSLVMAMALAGSADVQACHRHGGCYAAPTCGCYGGGYYAPVSYGCTGCYGGSVSYGCTGCYGGAVSYGCTGCFGGGYGCHGGLFGRRHGCYGGCYGGTTVGCYGGYVGCYGGSVGCYGGSVGCYGGVVGAPMGAPMVAPGGTPQKLDVPPAKKLPGEVSAPATIVVSLPVEAKLTIDGYVSQQTSAQRTLVTSPIQPGQEFTYTLVAQTTQNGLPVSQTQRVTVRSGQQLPVRFDFTATPATARR